MRIMNRHGTLLSGMSGIRLMDDETSKRRKKYSDEKDRMSIGINADTNGHAVPFTLSRQSA